MKPMALAVRFGAVVGPAGAETVRALKDHARITLESREVLDRRPCQLEGVRDGGPGDPAGADASEVVDDQGAAVGVELAFADSIRVSTSGSPFGLRKPAEARGAAGRGGLRVVPPDEVVRRVRRRGRAHGSVPVGADGISSKDSCICIRDCERTSHDSSVPIEKAMSMVCGSAYA